MSGLIGGGLSVFLCLWLRKPIARFWIRWHNRKYPRYGRELTQAEERWLGQMAGQLSLDKSEETYPKWIWLVSGGFLPVVIGMGVMCAVVYFALQSLIRPLPDDAILWMRVDIGASLVLGVFLGIFLAAIAMIWFSRHSNTLRDYLVYSYGWGYMTPQARGAAEIYTELTHQLRRDVVSADTPYNGDYFSDLIFHRTTPAWKGWTLGVAILTAVFFILDARVFHTVFEDRVELSPYFSLVTYDYAMTDIRSVDRRCVMAVDEGSVYPSLSLKANFPNGHKVDLLSNFGGDETTQAAAVKSLMAKIPSTIINDTVVKAAPIVKSEPTAENCISLIKSRYEGAQRDDYLAIMGWD